MPDDSCPARYGIGGLDGISGGVDTRSVHAHDTINFDAAPASDSGIFHKINDRLDAYPKQYHLTGNVCSYCGDDARDAALFSGNFGYFLL